MEDAFAAEGIVVRVIVGAVRAVDEADIAEGVEAVVVDPIIGLFAADEPASKVEVAADFAAAGVGFDDGIGVRAVPVEFVGAGGVPVVAFSTRLPSPS